MKSVYCYSLGLVVMVSFAGNDNKSAPELHGFNGALDDESVCFDG